MKKFMIVVLSTMLLTGCSVFERGNYDKDRTGYVLSGDLLVSYHTNSVGEIDVFMIDQVFDYFEALDYVSFDNTNLEDETIEPSIVTTDELATCGITHDEAIPRFIRIEEKTYFYHIRDNGYCTFDEYVFHEEGYSLDEITDVESTTYIEDLNRTLFKDADFKVNTFDTIIFIENITFNNDENMWIKEIVTALPMSIKQSGNMFDDNSDFVSEVTILERYVLNNQSVNLLSLKEGYESPDVNNIWSDETITRLGRDHDVIKSVRIKKTGDIISIITDTLSRLGMFS